MDESLLSLPILPAIGLAGISLGDSVEDVIVRHGEPLQRRNVGTSVDAVEYDCFFALFDAGRVATVSAEAGYLGQTLQGAYVGMAWLDLLRIYPDLYFDATFIWMPQSIDGLQFSVESPDGELGTVDEEGVVNDPTNAYVSSISVNSRGERGGPWESTPG